MTPLWPGAPRLWSAAQRFGEDGVPGGEIVSVRRRPRVTRPGSTVESVGEWSDAGEHEVEGVGLDRMVSSDLVSDTGEPVVQRATIFGPTDGDIEKGDRVYFSNGVIVEVDGVPNRQPNMINGWRPPMTVSVKVTHG